MTKSEAAKYEREKQERLAKLRKDAWNLAKQAKLMADNPVDWIWGYIAGHYYNAFEKGYVGEHACDYLDKV